MRVITRKPAARPRRTAFGSLLTYGLADVVTLSRFISGSEAGEERKRSSAASSMRAGFRGDYACRRQRLLAIRRGSASLRHCDNCLEPPLTGMHGSRTESVSCVYRTGQRFGVSTHQVRAASRTSAYSSSATPAQYVGIGREFDERQWSAIFRQLVAAGLLGTDDEGYGTLRLIDASRAVLRGEASVRLRHVADRVERKSRKKATRSERSSQALAIAAHETSVWESLRTLRARLAKEQGIPAYRIFSDASLLQMLRERPQSHSELAKISGVGEVKLERYGEDFLGVLTANGNRE